MTTTIHPDVRAAIEQSITRNTRVHLVVDDRGMADVLALCDDSANENDGSLDAWGTDEDDGEWRLCVSK